MGIDSEEILCAPYTDPLFISTETSKRAKIELNEDPDVLRRNIILLRQRIEETGNPVMNARLDDIFLAAFLRTKKHDIHRAFDSVKKFYDIQRNYPVHFELCLLSEKPYLFKKPLLALCPQPDYLGRRVVLGFPRNINVDKYGVEDVFQYSTTLLKILMEDPQLQVVGLVLILDLGGFTLLQQARIITPTIAWLVVNIIQECIPFRLREIHIVNQAFHFSALYAMFSPFLKEKLRKKIKLHGKSSSSLHAAVSSKILPPELGGSSTSIKHNLYLTTQLFGKYENKIKGWRHIYRNKIHETDT